MGLHDSPTRFDAASEAFAVHLRTVRADQWRLPTPCPEWTVRDLVNHMTRGNLNYAALAHGGRAAQFLRLRDADALGADPLGAYSDSVRTCRAAFAEPGVLETTLDYPFGRIPGRQALAVRAADALVHTWDLARALGADDTLDADLLHWLDAHRTSVYADLPELPVFAAPVPSTSDTSLQDRLLNLMGRDPAAQAWTTSGR